MTRDTLQLYRATQTLFRAFHYLQPRMKGGALAPPQPMNGEALAGCILHGCMAHLVTELRQRRAAKTKRASWFAQPKPAPARSAIAPTYDHKEVTMKTHTQIRFASLTLLAVLCMTLAALPALAGPLYENGPINGNNGGWGISSGEITSDSINLNSSRSNVYSISVGTWAVTGNILKSLDWSITSQENGGTVYGSGTASGASLTDTFISTNTFGYNIDLVTVSGLNVNLDAGTYWLNLQNAQTPSGSPVLWDENSGVGCSSPGCPSQASDSAVGTIPSEAFTINGSTGGTTPEPSSLALFGSGVLGLGGLLRRRFLG